MSTFAESEAQAKKIFEDRLDDCEFNYREDTSGLRIELIPEHRYIGQEPLDLN